MKNKFKQCKKFWKKTPQLIKYLIIIALIFTTVVISAFVLQFGHKSFANTSEEWAQFGDYIGGTLNPIFALLSFSALLYTITIQLKQIKLSEKQLTRTLTELKLSKEELELTRQELARSADAQINSQLVMQQQLKTQNSQQFDSIFFAMLRELNTLLAKLEEIPPKYIINDNYEHGDSISTLDKIYQKIFTTDLSSIHEIQTQLLQEKEIAQYFMLLYQLLKIIDTKIIGDYSEPTKKMYSNIVRASISEKALQLLIVNVSYPEFKQYRNLVEKFAFFEHVSFEPSNNGYNLLLINLVAKLNKIAFGDSIYFKILQNKTLFSIFVPKHQILNVLDLYKQTFLTLNHNQIIEIGIANGKACYQLSKDIDGKEHKIFLDYHGHQPTYYQTTNDPKPWMCHSSINDDIKIYDGSTNYIQEKLLYTIQFEKDGQVTIQYEA